MPPNPYVEILTAMMAVLGGRNLGGLLSHEGGILITGISAPVGRHMRVPHVCLSVCLSFLYQEGYNEKAAICKPGRGLALDTVSAGTLTLNFPASGTVRNQRC